jgi:hypothetical protein
VSYVEKSWCREHVNYDDVVILPVDKSELPARFGQKMNPLGPSNIVTTGKPIANQPLTRTTPISKRARGDFIIGAPTVGVVASSVSTRVLSARAAEHRDRIWHVLTHSGHGKEYHSITSSARVSNSGGIVRPSAFAVLRLITSSTLVLCWIGRSASFAPLRIFST